MTPRLVWQKPAEATPSSIAITARKGTWATRRVIAPTKVFTLVHPTEKSLLSVRYRKRQTKILNSRNRPSESQPNFIRDIDGIVKDTL